MFRDATELGLGEARASLPQTTSQPPQTGTGIGLFALLFWISCCCRSEGYLFVVFCIVNIIVQTILTCRNALQQDGVFTIGPLGPCCMQHTLMASAGTPYRLVPAHFYPWCKSAVGATSVTLHADETRRRANVVTSRARENSSISRAPEIITRPTRRRRRIIFPRFRRRDAVPRTSRSRVSSAERCVR